MRKLYVGMKSMQMDNEYICRIKTRPLFISFASSILFSRNLKHLRPDEVFNIETVLVFMNYSTVLSRSVANLTQSMAELFGYAALLVTSE